MNTQLSTLDFIPSVQQALYSVQEDEKEPNHPTSSRASEQRVRAAGARVFHNAGSLLQLSSKSSTTQERANRLVAGLYNPARDFRASTTAMGGVVSKEDLVAPATNRPQRTQQALSPLEFFQRKWHDTSSKITAMSGLEKQTQQAWQDLQKDPQVQKLKQATEQRFQQKISATTVARDKAQFGCRFDYRLNPLGIEFNPAIGIADDLDENGKKRCLILELTNLSVSDEFSRLAQKAIDRSISREEYIRQKEEIELHAQKTIADPIVQNLEEQGTIPRTNSTYFTDPQISVTGDLKKLRDLHNEVYGKEWDRLSQATRSPSSDHPSDPHSVVHVTGDPLFDDIIQGAIAHRIEPRVGKRPAVALETVSEAARKEAHSSDNPFRDRFVSAGVEVGMLSAANAVTGVPGFLAIPGAHLVAKGAADLEETTREFLHNRSPQEFSLDGGGEYPNMYDMAVVGNLAAKAAQIPSKALSGVHHAIANTIGKGLDKIGVIDANIAHMAFQIGSVVLEAAKVDSQDPR